MNVSLRFAAALGLGIVCAVPLTAQKHVPSTYAITGARIVPVSGPAIDTGTIVMRDGVITAVGARVTVPADAVTIDGSGLSVYPGLIDSYGSLGQNVTAAAVPAGGRGGRGAAAAATTTESPDAAPNSNYVVGLRPEVSVINALKPGETEFEAPHQAGLTTALTALPTGIFRGSAALINLSGDSASMIVVRDNIAQSIGFSRGGGGFGGGGRGGYPGTIMGAFAALRQELLDAQHYQLVMAAYARNPRGMPRPAYDASLEALQPVIAGTQPVIMQANTEREILRAVDLAKEFHLKAMIGGGAEAYKTADQLKTADVPVLLTLNFPRRGVAATGGRGGRGGGGNADEPEPLSILRERVMAPKGPGLLAKNGVQFAFESGGDYTDLLANLRKSVTGGLTPEQALRAFTLTPAELFGVSNRMGTIETGKVADLTITRGDLFDANARVTEVFVDGRPITVPPPAPTLGGGRGGARGGLAANGRWNASVTIDGHVASITLWLRQDQDRVYGVVEGDLGTDDIANGSIGADGTLSFTANLELTDGSALVEFDGALDAQGIRGTVSAEDHADGSFTASHN